MVTHPIKTAISFTGANGGGAVEV